DTRLPAGEGIACGQPKANCVAIPPQLTIIYLRVSTSLIRGACLGSLALALLPLVVWAQNLIPNPGFENWVGTLPLAWLTSALVDSQSAVRSSDAHTGDYSLRCQSGDTSAYAMTTTLVQPVSAYRFSAFAKSDHPMPGTFLVSWLSMAGRSVGTPELILVGRSTSYREYARTAVSPESAFFCGVTFVTTPMVPAVVVYLDDITLEPSPTGIERRASFESRKFELYPAQPNPLSRFTTIGYSTSAGAVVRLKIYDLVGNEVATLVDEYQSAGMHTSYWDATNDTGKAVSPGLYFCRLEVGDKTLTQKLILLGE
ncbi:MAG: T9SS type A sorting domain-containing protein, partial [candidate division WOR-3 bacterium]